MALVGLNIWTFAYWFGLIAAAESSAKPNIVVMLMDDVSFCKIVQVALTPHLLHIILLLGVPNRWLQPKTCGAPGLWDKNIGAPGLNSISFWGSRLHCDQIFRAPGIEMIGLRAPQQKFLGSRPPPPTPFGPCTTVVQAYA